jgi:hypothetical protein
MKKFWMFVTSFFPAFLCPVDAQLFADGSIQQASKQAPRMPQCSVLGWCTAFFFFCCLSLWVPQKSFLSESVQNFRERNWQWNSLGRFGREFYSGCWQERILLM